MSPRAEEFESPGDEGSFASVIETHSGVVFFVGDKAYKIKKPVRFAFLDFTTREARLVACRKEVELNRRLAPDVYLGVADVTGPDGSLWDHMVVMRRLPRARSLGRLAAEEGTLDLPLRDLATTLAQFHQRAATSPECSRAASRDTTLSRWETNGEQIEGLVGRVFDRTVHERVLSLARRFLAGRDRLFESRIAAGRARDGHGDLLADDIFCLPDGPRVLDCLEFDDSLRLGDVLGDVASLAMDLERLGRSDLARTFIDHYRANSGDDWPSSLGHHYIAYRAQVRALVAGLRFDQGEAGSKAAAGRLLALSLEHLEAGRVRLVLVGGLPGTGKSTWAAEAGAALDAAVLRSDEVRKRLAGIEPTEPAPAGFAQGLYSPESTAATYDELLAQARAQLSMGKSVVIDATFSDPAWRRRARELANESAADLDELRCLAPRSVIEARVAERSRRGGDPSDATIEVVAALAEREQAWPEAAVLPTEGDTASVRQALLGHLGVVPVLP